MNCDWKYDGPSEKVAGFNRYSCGRHGCDLTADSPYGPEKIENAAGTGCRGWPRPHEWLDWLTLITDALLRRPGMQSWLRRHLGPADAVPIAGAGPGRELAMLLAQLRAGSMGPSCQGRAEQMNRWGAAGCREHRAEIIAWLKESYDKASRLDVFMCGLHAMRLGVIWRLRRRDLLGSLVDLAIKRAERNAERGMRSAELLDPAAGSSGDAGGDA